MTNRDELYALMDDLLASYVPGIERNIRRQYEAGNKDQLERIESRLRSLIEDTYLKPEDVTGEGES